MSSHTLNQKRDIKSKSVSNIVPKPSSTAGPNPISSAPFSNRKPDPSSKSVATPKPGPSSSVKPSVTQQPTSSVKLVSSPAPTTGELYNNTTKHLARCEADLQIFKARLIGKIERLQPDYVALAKLDEVNVCTIRVFGGHPVGALSHVKASEYAGGGRDSEYGEKCRRSDFLSGLDSGSIWEETVNKVKAGETTWSRSNICWRIRAVSVAKIRIKLCDVSITKFTAKFHAETIGYRFP